jgi:hypothetical protein
VYKQTAAPVIAESVPEDVPPGLGQYEDFHTIDWLRDMARDRQRHRQLARRQHQGSIFQKLKAVQDASSGWICVLFVACLAGMYTMHLYHCKRCYSLLMFN